MLKREARLVAAGLQLVDLAALVASFPIAYVIRDRVLGGRFSGLYPLGRYWPMLVLALVLWAVVARLGHVYGAYRTRSLPTEIARVARATALVAVLVAAGSFLAKQQFVSRLLIALWLALAFLAVVANRILIRLAARAVRRRGYNTRTFALVGTGELALEMRENLLSHPHWGYNFAGFVLERLGDVRPPGPVLGTVGEVGSILERNVLDLVVFAVERERLADVERAVALCDEQGVAVKIALDLFPGRQARMGIEELDGIPLLGLSSGPQDAIGLGLKRAFDLAVSAIVLVVLAPLFLAIAAAIRLESRGPVLFRQRRVGLSGREFTLYKFRSMHAGAEALLPALRKHNEADGPVFKMREDPRVTRVGRLLRRASLDELPQFWNVLRGEMSVVGPRPPLPSEVRAYARWQRRRLSVRPGITCTWQVSGRSDVGFEEWMQLDLHYIDNWSLWGDFGIVLRTIPAVLLGRGAR